MKRRLKTNIVQLIILLIIVGIIALAHYSVPTSSPTRTTRSTTASSSSPSSSPQSVPQTASVTGCDQSLWQHVYNPSRLHVLNACTQVSGVIDHIIHEKDGDTHIRVKLDAPYQNMLNSANVSDQYGDLVVEPVCEYVPTQTDAESACQNYTSPISIPADGTHVLITGAFVFDADHGWNEIHPVTSIRVQ